MTEELACRWRLPLASPLPCCRLRRRRRRRRASSSPAKARRAVAPDMALLSLTVMREAQDRARGARRQQRGDGGGDRCDEGRRHRRARPADGRRPDQSALRLRQQAGRHAGSRARRLPGHQHAVGARARSRQDRRDPRQVGDARRQPGRRHHLHQRRSGGRA